jgi:uncharacterized radical SAM superfamily Fe-S cluster-containing enzyme
LLHETTSLCLVCKNAVPAVVVARGGEVFMEKTCPAHGFQEARLSNSAEWYERTRRIAPVDAPPRHRPREIALGCPFDCGACEAHRQKVRLPVITITSACNLDCPICYVHNKNDDAWHMGEEELRRTLSHLKDELGDDLDLLNFTGGEPTLHPHFEDFLRIASEAGVHRVAICTNGVKLARDEALVRRLAELKARVAISFDSFEAEADELLQGLPLLETKTRALRLLEKHGVDVTLIPVMTRGVNEKEIGRILELAIGLSNVRHVEVHTMTYTGQGGIGFPRSGRISMHEVLEEIEATTGGLLHPADFVPSPCAHPLCYQIAYLLLDPAGGPPIPFTRLIAPETLYACLADRLYLEPSRRLEEAMREGIDRLWAEGGPEAERQLPMLKRAIGEMFPADRVLSRAEALQIAERTTKAIYVHSHMDEETFDVERLAQCCDSNCYPDGTSVPVCAYNVLYREKDERFTTRPRAWGERSGGRTDLPVLPVIG